MAISQQDFENIQAMMAQQNQALLEFRAGMLQLKGTRVEADPRRGTVRVLVQDSLLHIQWLTRPGGQLDNVNDIVVFPGDAVWERVPECKTGRVYLLRLKQANKKHFFWLQEPSADKDEENARLINQYINNPPHEGPVGGGANPLAALGGAGLGDLNPEMMNYMSEEDQQLMSLLGRQGGAGAGSGAGSGSGSGSGSGAGSDEDAQLMDLIRSSAGNASSANTGAGAGRQQPPASGAPAPTPAATRAPATSGSGAAPAATSTGSSSSSGSSAPVPPVNINALATAMRQFAQHLQAQQQLEGLPLRSVLEADRVIPLLESDLKAMESLLPHLPEGQRDTENLRDTIRSPQMYQTLARMTQILNSPQCGALFASLGLQPGDMGVLGFIKAIQEQVDKESKQQAGPTSTPAPAPAATSTPAPNPASPTAKPSSPTAKPSSPTAKPATNQPPPKDGGPKKN